MFPVPVAARTTVTPWIRLLFASRAVTVIVLVEAPATIEPGAAVTLDVVADGAPGTTVSAAVCVMAVPPIVAETTLA